MKVRRLLEMSDSEIIEYIKSCHIDKGGTLGLSHFYIKQQNGDIEWCSKFFRPAKLIKRFPVVNSSTWNPDHFLHLKIQDRERGMTITVEKGVVLDIHRYNDLNGIFEFRVE